MAKTKALISFAVTAKLICVFVFAYAKRWFSHDAAHMCFMRTIWHNTYLNYQEFGILDHLFKEMLANEAAKRSTG